MRTRHSDKRWLIPVDARWWGKLGRRQGWCPRLGGRVPYTITVPPISKVGPPQVVARSAREVAEVRRVRADERQRQSSARPLRGSRSPATGRLTGGPTDTTDMTASADGDQRRLGAPLVRGGGVLNLLLKITHCVLAGSWCVLVVDLWLVALSDDLAARRTNSGWFGGVCVCVC